ncbi:MAG: NAD(P)-binding domain-containing protein, partial [Rhodococcus sp.]|nr:NAD(P)-binding domain-containing protein [Rhodococcus sp. (in: high G+C Gram-positive bacteria)]
MQRWRDRHSTRRRSRVMRIGIIGAGQIGGTLTRRLAALGHDVRVSNSRTPDTLAELEAETGAKAVRSTEAAEGAELVIVSIPQKNVVDLPAGILSGAVAGAPVIETNNYYPQQRDGLIAAIEDGQTESGWVQEHLGVPVFKAFNGIWWKHLLEKGLP